MTFIIIIRHCNFQTHQISIILIIIIFITHWCQGFHYSPCRKRRTSRLHTFCPGREVHRDRLKWETFNLLCFLPQIPPICEYFIWTFALVFLEHISSAPCWSRNQTWCLSLTRMIYLLNILIETDFPKCQIARSGIETSPCDGERAKWPLSCRKENEKYREVHSIPANGRYFYLLDYPQDLWCWCFGNEYFGILWLLCSGGIPSLIL